jgi:pyridoxal phosphate enzyme (YggS family)
VSEEAVDPAGLGARLAAIRARVARAAARSDRDAAQVRILAVTKGHPAAAVTASLAAGLADIGESRVQEAEAKREQVGDLGASWHMVGHVQRNKARAAAELFDVVHSVDSPAIAGSLAAHRPAGSMPLRVFLEVELTGIPTRSGVDPSQAPGLLDALGRLPALHAVGLMTIAPPGSEAMARQCFARLRELRDRLRDDSGVLLPELSMGMSDDFEVAVEEGATVLRLGRALFGERPARGR